MADEDDGFDDFQEPVAASAVDDDFGDFNDDTFGDFEQVPTGVTEEPSEPPISPPQPTPLTFDAPPVTSAALEAEITRLVGTVTYRGMTLGIFRPSNS